MAISDEMSDDVVRGEIRATLRAEKRPPEVVAAHRDNQCGEHCRRRTPARYVHLLTFRAKPGTADRLASRRVSLLGRYLVIALKRASAGLALKFSRTSPAESQKLQLPDRSSQANQ